MEPIDTFNLIIGDCSLPLDIQCEQDGRPARVGGVAGRDFAFRFVYRGIPLGGRYRNDGQEGQLELDGDIGPMPFSAESALGRLVLKTVVDTANGHLGPVFAVAGGRIHLAMSFPLAYPVTSVGLIGGVAEALLRVKPYLEAIEVVLRPPAETAKTGQAALRPEWRRPADRKRRA